MRTTRRHNPESSIGPRTYTSFPATHASSRSAESSRYAFAIVKRADATYSVGVAIDLETANIEILGGPASELLVRADGRFVAILPGTDDGLSRLIDRETQGTLQLGYPGWGPEESESNDPTIMILRSPDSDEPGTHVVFLPGLEEAWLEGWFQTERGWVTDDGRRLLVSDDGLHVIAPGQTVATRLGDGRRSAKTIQPLSSRTV